MSRCLFSLLLAISLACVPATGGTGCAAALPLIHQIATVVADVTAALEQARGAVETFPGLDPAQRAAALEAIRRATILRDAVRAAAQTADSVADKDYLAAVDALLVAVQEVYELTRPFGVAPAPAVERKKLGASRPGHVLVPPVDELRAGLTGARS
jgi:hypothetical protein